MRLKRHFSITTAGLFAATLGLFFSACEPENPGEPRANTEPETFISEISPGVTTKIAWYGTDRDGRVETFEYKWDDGAWVETANLSETFPIDDPTNPYTDFKFADLDDEKTFYVRAIDNANGKDPSPATASMTPTTSKPETQITEGPMTGDIVGADVKFVWDGVDKDGSIDGFEWTLDDLSSWTAVEEYVTEHLFLGLGAGPHVFYVRAVDNFGAKDQTPAQSAFVVSTGFIPKLGNLSPVADGGGWFSAVDLALSWKASVDYYQGVMPAGAFSYAYDDSSGYDVSTTPLASGWVESTSYTVSGSVITDGNHTFYIKARDASGNVDTMRIRFSAAPFAPAPGSLLLLDNFSWTPSCYSTHSEIASKISTGFLNGVTYDTRDLDDEGAGILTPALLGQYEAVVVYTDGGYNSADYGNLFAAYAKAGGNLMITGYSLASFGASTIMTPFGFYPAIFGTFAYPSNGLIGVATGGMIETDGLYLPLPAGCEGRSTERIYPNEDNTEAIFYNDVHSSSSYTSSRPVASIASMNNGANYVIIFGQSLAFIDHDDDDTKTFGNRVMALWGIPDTDNP